MPGYQEILIISAIVLGVIFIPRMMEPKKPAPRLVRPRKSLSGRWRLAIALSIVYPLAAAAVTHPWDTSPFAFGFIGLGPVLGAARFQTSIASNQKCLFSPISALGKILNLGISTILRVKFSRLELDITI